MTAFNKQRRAFLQWSAALGTWSLAQKLLGTTRTEVDVSQAERLIIVYHPDGVFLEQWHPPQSSGPIVSLSESLQPLAPYRDQLLLLRHLSLLDGRGDGHDDAARCLLTGSLDTSEGSLDVNLAADSQKFLLHLGVQSSKSQGHSVSFLPGGAEKLADDSPLAVYQRLFQSQLSGEASLDAPLLKNLEQELQSFIGQVDIGREKNKLQQHLRELQLFSKNQGQCPGYDLSSYSNYDENKKWIDSSAPLILSMQMLNLVQAMECGLAKVASLQFSRHTSPLKMDFDWLNGWNGLNSMESHQASHNSAAIHAQQKKWLNQQLLLLFDQLAHRPEPTPGRVGSMLDFSLVFVVTEIAQGASHSRQDMPFYLIGGKGIKGYNPGRIIDCKGAPHSQVLQSLTHVLGGQSKGAYKNAGDLAGFMN
ncbi:MAG: DUF1552 domain-containing protein [Proteobacteria bacterium]|nr:DUF1552 domain-containing protein [Pseudomonadota bacterium]